MSGLKFIDVFSGIGGFRQGFEKNGHTCIAFSEIDKHAIQSYKAIYGDSDVELGDISVIPENKLKELGRDVELVVGEAPAPHLVSPVKKEDLKIHEDRCSSNTVVQSSTRNRNISYLKTSKAFSLMTKEEQLIR